MILKLLSIKDYCKKMKITDAAVRKQIKSDTIKSCEYNHQIYVIIKDEKEQQQQTKIKLLNSKIKELKSEAKQYIRQDELIKEQKQRIEKLENKIENIQDKKDELYENIVAHMTNLQIENKGK